MSMKSCACVMLLSMSLLACSRSGPPASIAVQGPAAASANDPSATGPATQPAADPALRSPYAFDVEVTLSDAARKRLADSAESIIVSAIYFADAKAGAPPAFVNQVGQVDIGKAQIELNGAGRAAFDGSAVLRERLPSTEGDLQLNVNVFSGRRSSEDNLLDCGFFQDAVQVAAAQPVRIACQLIAE